MLKTRSYYEGVDGPIAVEHEDHGTGMRSEMALEGHRAACLWRGDEGPRTEVEAHVARVLVGEYIRAGLLPAERCDHVSAEGRCCDRWTVEVDSGDGRCHWCMAHGHRYLRAYQTHAAYAAGVGRQALVRVTARE